MRRFLSSCCLAWLVGLLLAACTLSDVPPTVPPTPDLPRVQFQFPANNALVIEGTDLTIQVLAQDETSGIARVELFVDDQLYREASPVDANAVTTFLVDLNWLAEGTGIHSLTARAYRHNDVPSPEATILVEVVASGGTRPAVTGTPLSVLTPSAPVPSS